METRSDMWKMTAIGLVVVAATAVVTGLVVANRTGTKGEARVDAPAASPATAPAASPAAVAQAPATTPPATPAVPPAATERPAHVAQTPPQSAIEACNHYAAAHSEGQRDSKGKVMEVVKDGAIGAVGGAAVGALGGAIAGGGKGAGKGAAIGGLLGGGGGSVYGLYDNKKNDEGYRTAYASCMKTRGYTS
jgi:hypothetical protein